jgi:hypothetical protein
MKIRHILLKLILLFGSLLVSITMFAQPGNPTDSAPLDSDLLLPIILTTGFVAFLLKRKKRNSNK